MKEKTPEAGSPREQTGIYNPPGQSWISYRIGVQSTFFQEMLAELPTETLKTGSAEGKQPLAQLTTRSESDATIALLNAWACVLDILTFYQEIIANENYIATATERVSIVELARLLGYLVDPGLSAEVYLAFQVDESEGAPRRTTIEVGARLASVPAEGQESQVFETLENLVARPQWNLMRPNTGIPQVVGENATSLILAGSDLNLEQGDKLLLTSQEMVGCEGEWRLVTLTEVEPDEERDVTTVYWEPQSGEETIPAQPLVYALPTNASIFGYDAPSWDEMPYEVKQANVPPGTSPEDYNDWPGMVVDPEVMNLDAEYSEIVPGSWLVRVIPSSYSLQKVQSNTIVAVDEFSLNGQVSQITSSCWNTQAVANVLEPAVQKQTAVLVAGGAVLIAGGQDADGQAVATLQRYDPDTETLDSAGVLNQARYNHTATVLGNGQVLFAGGVGNDPNDPSESVYLASAEIYDPDTETSRTVGAMPVARADHTAVYLPSVLLPSEEGDNGGNGQEQEPSVYVMIAGGRNEDGALAEVAYYNPAEEIFMSGPPLRQPRYNHTATLLSSNKVLVAGGENGSRVLKTYEIYNPEDPEASTCRTLKEARTRHTATYIPMGGDDDDQVILVAGKGKDGNALKSIELYSGAGAPLGLCAHSLEEGRYNHTATLLNNNQTLIAGGQDESEILFTTAQFKPNADNPVQGEVLQSYDLDAARTDQTANLLYSGLVFVAGGFGYSLDPDSGNSEPEEAVLNSFQIYNPAIGTFTQTGRSIYPSCMGTATLLNNGYVFELGGGSQLSWLGPTEYDGGVGGSDNAELFNPNISTFSETTSASFATYGGTATLLRNGQVLIYGGIDADYEAMLYDPESETFTDLNNSDIHATFYATASLLPNGDVLLAGGKRHGGYAVVLNDPVSLYYSTNLTLIYEYGSQSFKNGPNMPEGRMLHTATALLNGMILIVGGVGGDDVDDTTAPVITSALLYNPGTNTFSYTGSPPSDCQGYLQTATMLGDGTVLVAGGLNKNNEALDTACIYDPNSGTFSQVGQSMSTPRFGATATLIAAANPYITQSADQVLISGGVPDTKEGTEALAGAELFSVASRTFTPTGSLLQSRGYAYGTFLQDGRILVSGGVPRFTTGEAAFSEAEIYTPPVATPTNGLRDTVIYAQSEPLELGTDVDTTPVAGNTVELTGIVPILPGGKTLAVGGERLVYRVITDQQGLRLVSFPYLNSASVRQGDLLTQLKMPTTVSLPESPQITLWYFQNSEGFQGAMAGRAEWFELLEYTELEDAEVDSELVHETVTVVFSGLSEDRLHTTITFTPDLRNAYYRETSQILGNLAAASQGETVAGEALGSGNGNIPNQTFSLPDPPLSFLLNDVGEPTPQLEVLVDEVTWRLVESFYGQTPTSQVYTLRIDDEQNAVLTFGDGVNGARLPSGDDNVVANYRKGIGSSGNVDADSITQLQNTPLGVEDVTNPQRSVGGLDAESDRDAREMAPVSTDNLDRIVSLDDYQTFSLDFPGVAKAQAVSTRRLGGPLIGITIVPMVLDDEASESRLLDNLRVAIGAAQARFHPLFLDGFAERSFDLTARLYLNDPREATAVTDAVEAQLTAQFSIANAELGQGIGVSDVAAAIQDVAGVKAVNIQAFHYTLQISPDPTGVADFLAAESGRFVSQGELGDFLKDLAPQLEGNPWRNIPANKSTKARVTPNRLSFESDTTDAIQLSAGDMARETVFLPAQVLIINPYGLKLTTDADPVEVNEI